MMNVQNLDRKRCDGEQEQPLRGVERPPPSRKPPYYSSSSSSSDSDSYTKDGDTIAQATPTAATAHLKNDKIQNYREQIAQIKKLISGTGVVHQQHQQHGHNEGKKNSGQRGNRGESNDTTARGDGEGGEANGERKGSRYGGAGEQQQPLGLPAAMHSKRQSSKNEPARGQSYGEGRMAAEALMPPKCHQSFQQPHRSSVDSPRHSRSPSNAPLESEYGRQRQREILAEEERRRSLSRSNRLSFDDRQSMNRSSNGGGGRSAASCSISNERSFQQPMVLPVPCAIAQQPPSTSQLNTASWHAAHTPSHGGSRLSSKPGPPMQMSELHSQGSALHQGHDGQMDGLYLNQQAQFINSNYSTKEARNVQAYYSQNAEAQFLPGLKIEEQMRAQVQSLQCQNAERVPPTRNNLGPPTLKSSTDSFSQMQGDILRLQEKIRGLETRLNPAANASLTQSHMQSPQTTMNFNENFQQTHGANMLFPDGQISAAGGSACNNLIQLAELQNQLYQNEPRDKQQFQGKYQEVQNSTGTMQNLTTESFQAKQGQKGAVNSDQQLKHAQGLTSAQPGLGTTSSSMSTLSPAAIQADYNLPLKKQSIDQDRPGKQLQESLNSASQCRMAPIVCDRPTNLTTFGGDPCHFSNSQIFQRSGQARTGREHAESPSSRFAEATGRNNGAMTTNQSQGPQANAPPGQVGGEGKQAEGLVQVNVGAPQVTAPGVDLVNISSIALTQTQTLKDMPGSSCYTSSNGPARQAKKKGVEEQSNGQKRKKSAAQRGRAPVADVPMTSRSHSRSITTGHKVTNLSKLRSCNHGIKRNGKSKNQSMIHSRLNRNPSQKKMQNLNVQRLTNQSRNGSKNRGSRDREETAKSPQPMDRQSDEDRASYRTYNVGRSSQRSHKTLKSTKSQRLSRRMHIQGMPSRTRSHKKQHTNSKQSKNLLKEQSYMPHSKLLLQSQGSRLLSRNSRMSRGHSELRSRHRQSTAAKRGHLMGGRARSVSEGHSGSGARYHDAVSESQQEWQRRAKKENQRLREKLKLQEETNTELRKEIERLHEKLEYMDELHKKSQKAKIQYGKVLSQLESSEMIRMEQQDKIKDLVNKVYKLKRQKRDLQEKLTKTAVEKGGGTRNGSMKLSVTAGHFGKSKAEKKIKGASGAGANRMNPLSGLRNDKLIMAASAIADQHQQKLKSSKSQANGMKKPYESVRSTSGASGRLTKQQLGVIANEATQQLLQIQSLHHGVGGQYHSKSNSRSHKSAKKSAQLVGARLAQEDEMPQITNQSGAPTRQQPPPYFYNKNTSQDGLVSGMVVLNSNTNSFRPTNEATGSLTSPNSFGQLQTTAAQTQAQLLNTRSFGSFSAHQNMYQASQNQQDLQNNVTLGKNQSITSRPQSSLGGNDASQLGSQQFAQHSLAGNQASNVFHLGQAADAVVNEREKQSRNQAAAANNISSGQGKVQTWEPPMANSSSTRVDGAELRQQQSLNNQFIHQKADDLYIRYRNLIRDLDPQHEDLSRSGHSANFSQSQDKMKDLLAMSNSNHAISASNHFSSHKGIDYYQAQAESSQDFRRRHDRLEPVVITEAESMTQPDTIVNIPIRTGLSPAPTHHHHHTTCTVTRHDAQTAILGEGQDQSVHTHNNRSMANDSSVRIDDLHQQNYGYQRSSDGLQKKDEDAVFADRQSQFKSRNGSKSAIFSRDMELHSSGLSASDCRHLRASKASAKYNGLSKDTIGSLGGYARLKEAPPSIGRRDWSASGVDFAAVLRPMATGTEMKEDPTRYSRLQDSAGGADQRSSLGVLSNDTEKISRRYLNLTSHDKPFQE